MINPLTSWAEKHDGNFMYKWSQYFDVYHHHFKRFRGKEVKILEIGIYGGGSLQMWKWYFGNKAHITGMDIDPFCKKYAEDRVDIIIGDQADAELLDTLSEYDIIIDDGGHYMSQQIASFTHLYEKVKDGGIYLVEDTHTSYVPEFIDGTLTFIEYCKRLIDAMHSHYPTGELNDFSKHTRSISFYDSMVVLEKQLMQLPVQTHYSGEDRK